MGRRPGLPVPKLSGFLYTLLSLTAWGNIVVVVVVLNLSHCTDGPGNRKCVTLEGSAQEPWERGDSSVPAFAPSAFLSEHRSRSGISHPEQ